LRRLFSDRRAIRGSSWGGGPESARCAYRNGGWPDCRSDHIGFRVVRSLSDSEISEYEKKQKKAPKEKARSAVKGVPGS
jgi:hypothetical protein